MNLLKFELYKIYSRKTILLGITLISLVIIVFSCVNYYSTKKVMNNDVLYPGSWWSDHSMYLNKLSSEIADMKSKGEIGFEYKNKVLEYKMQKAIKPPDLQSSAHLHSYFLFDNSVVYFMLGIFLILGLPPMFSDEYSTGVDALILSSKLGKGTTVAAKILATVIFTVIAACIVFIVHIIVNLLIYGTGNLSVPFQVMSTYGSSPYSFSLFGYLVIQFLTNLSADIMFGLMIVTVSAFYRNVMIPAFVGACAVCITCYFKVVFPLFFQVITDMFKINSFFPDDLYSNFKAYNILGKPVLYPQISFVLTMIYAISFIFIIKYFYKRHTVLN